MYKVKKFLCILPGLLIIFLSGCDTKKEDTYDQSETLLPRDTSADVDTTGPADTIKKATYQQAVLDITGKWSGEFDNRSAVLTITSQDSMNFSGKFTVNYKEKLNQEVKGTFFPDTKEFTMNDQIHSKYSGKYKGKINTDGNGMDGTFTLNLNGDRKNFSLTKDTD